MILLTYMHISSYYGRFLGYEYILNLIIYGLFVYLIATESRKGESLFHMRCLILDGIYGRRFIIREFSGKFIISNTYGESSSLYQDDDEYDDFERLSDEILI